jgi:HD-GYP domain-containing protein (c-di-GMP phosphodiesterase class II)
VTSPSQVTLAEVVAAISLAADLGLGQPMDHVLRSCALATRFADYLDVDESTRDATYWVTLFVSAGCTGDSFELARIFGDDLEYRVGTYRAGPTTRAQLRYLMGRAGAGSSVIRRALIRADLLRTKMAPVESTLVSHSRISSQLAAGLGLGTGVTSALEQTFARWDGNGLPRGLGGTDIELSMRICVLVDAAEVLERERGVDASNTVLTAARGTWFDPSLVDAWRSAALAVDPAADLWHDVVAAEPGSRTPLTEDEVDRALELIADYADLKSPWFTGHSRGVADLAASAAATAGLAPDQVRTLRRAALVHDIGRNGVPNSVWDKPGSLTDSEAERVHLHAYYTDRVLRRSGGLSHLAAIASAAHERTSGAGYPRSLSGQTIPLLGRFLEAADAYHAMREHRPHRSALPAEVAARALRDGVRAGEFDAAAVEAVLSVAGHRAGKRAINPAGLSARELDVLLLVARGLTNRMVAEQLGITPKTVGNFVERIYAKIGVSSRAEAALFAMQHGLVPPVDL